MAKSWAMRRSPIQRFGRSIAAVLSLVAIATLSLQPVRAAEPTAGTLDASERSVAWSGGPLVFTTFEYGCEPSGPTCDVFDLTVGSLPVDAPDVLISVAGREGSDVLSLHVYDGDGNQIASDSALTANPRVELRDIESGTYSVRVEAILATTGPTVSYDALAAVTDAGPAPDPEVPCTGEDGGLGPPPAEVLTAALNDDGRVVKLHVLVLLDGISEPFARAFFEKVAVPYAALDIEVVPTFRAVPAGAITSNVTTEIIDQTKDLVPGRRVPFEFDVVELLTSRNIEVLGVDAVAGQAECIGGAAFKEHSFNVSEGQEGTDQGGVPFGPLTLVPDFAAKITAHEIGHLFGGQHHFANCVEGALADGFPSSDSSPCSLMFNSADFLSLRFGIVNGRIIRGYALVHAAANDAPAAVAAPADPSGGSGSAGPERGGAAPSDGSGNGRTGSGDGSLPPTGGPAGLVALIGLALLLGLRRRASHS